MYKEQQKTAHVIKRHFFLENISQMCQMSSVTFAGAPVDFTKDFQKYDIYISEEGMYELLFSNHWNCYF